MAVPRSRHSNARKNTKRSHHAKVSKKLSKCTNCGEEHLPHRACLSCGYYGGQLVLSKEEA
ncbi:50S ribosomal protein L32 [Candidatus Aerophobetes bacterium]|uniref:Large ribosomal subunit protein bL32 n=1 Tax=Aerophobetes bacterium TaxID=2030807 RepID=A0A2A4X8G0_UNCAE|nr:MAG: 50S ribosomal protein L32 [Candidatus Aerophobetes bacterium]